MTGEVGAPSGEWQIVTEPLSAERLPEVVAVLEQLGVVAEVVPIAEAEPREETIGIKDFRAVIDNRNTAGQVYWSLYRQVAEHTDDTPPPLTIVKKEERDPSEPPELRGHLPTAVQWLLRKGKIYKAEIIERVIEQRAADRAAEAQQ